MLLKSMLANRGTAARLARAANLSRPYIWQCASGARSIPAALCLAVERETAGRVTADELRPDVRWVRVPDPAWPHPLGRPAIDVAAPVAQENRLEAA